MPLLRVMLFIMIHGGNMTYLAQETTDYGDNIKGGVYIFESKPKTKVASIIGYIAPKQDAVMWYKNPLSIDMRKRTFKQVGLMPRSL
jgi:hypothetical protein